MRKNHLIFNLLIDLVICICILISALNVSLILSLRTNNPNEFERNLIFPDQNQIAGGNCDKIGGIDDYYGEFEDIFVDGSKAYVSSSKGLYIYDVTNNNNPTLLSTWNYVNKEENYYTIFIASDYAYAINDLGFTILDVSSPSSPTFIGNYSCSIGLTDIFIDGNYAYLCVSWTGLRIVDISDKTNPSLESELSTANPFSIYKEGNTAYIASPNEGLITIDVTDKSNPVKLDSAFYTTHSVSVCVNDDYAYVASGTEGVYIFDISNPASILLVTQFLHPTQPQNAYDVQISDDLIYVSNYNHFYIINEISLEGNFTDGVYGFSSIEGDYAYYILVGEGYQILDISNTKDIKIINEIYSGGPHRGLYVDGNYAYVGKGGYGLGIYDISNPLNPTKVSDLHYELSNTPYPNKLVVKNNYAYLADGSNGLVVVDVHDKSNPINVSSYYAHFVRDVDVQDDYAFIVGDFDRLQILDISDPTNLLEVSNLAIENEMCVSITVDGDYAYISNNDNGDFMIVDISNILTPTLVSSTDLIGGTPRQLSVSGNYVFTGNSYDLIIYNVENKANPIEKSRTSFSFINYIHSNGTVTCASGKDKIRAYNTKDKENPTIIAEYFDGTEFEEIFQQNNFIYAANLFDGLTIINITGPTETTTTKRFGLNFFAEFIIVTMILGYEYIKRKKRK